MRPPAVHQAPARRPLAAAPRSALLSWTAALLLVLLWLAAPASGQRTAPSGDVARADGPRVHAVLFYSPGCPHCRDIMTDHLPPLVERYGDRLVIATVNTATEQGQALYRAVVLHFAIPRDRMGVPTMVIGKTVLVGSVEIPALFPALVERGLTDGGVDWPQVWPVFEPQGSERSGSFWTVVIGRFMLDPVGNSVSVAVLVLLAAALAVGISPMSGRRPPIPAMPAWATPALAAVGLGVAAYMAFVEVTGTAAVCGPVGDCNTVQQSEYARLAGVLPVGVLGVVGYGALILAWLAGVMGPVRWRDAAAVALWGMAVVATVFSLYLTFLEPFVIGATCAWCLTSALLAALILLSTTGAVVQPARAHSGDRYHD
jgi:uncharacterized membrane protein/thiol-disulfide isomerase/thioredoxin